MLQLEILILLYCWGVWTFIVGERANTLAFDKGFTPICEIRTDLLNKRWWNWWSNSLVQNDKSSVLLSSLQVSLKFCWLFVCVNADLNHGDVLTYLQPWGWQFLKLGVNESVAWQLHDQSVQVSHWRCYGGSEQNVDVHGPVFSASCPALCGSLVWAWKPVHHHSACNSICAVFWEWILSS
jgi:hypothetical protein